MAIASTPMSRAEESCLRLGSPDALRNRVRFMPSARARVVIAAANSHSVPPIASATTVATSFADFVASAMIACFTVMLLPRFRPSFDAGWPAARFETDSLSLNCMRPLSSSANSM